MTGRWAASARGLLGAAVLFAALAGPAAGLRRASAFAVCDEPPDDPSGLLAITSPAPGPQGYGGPAPITLTIQIGEGLALFPTGELTSTYEWGDGTSSTVVTLPCPNGIDSYWPTQALSHTYQAPGTYPTTWRFNFGGQVLALPFVIIFVTDAAAPTPPPPTPTPPPQPTPVPTVAGGATEAPGANATPTVAASPSPGATATQTATATPTRTATPTPTPAPVVAAGTGTPGDETSAPEPTVVANAEHRARTVISVEEIDEVSREPDVLATNLVIAGFTVWVLFSSVLLNQVLQAHRAEIDQRTSRFTRPLRRLAKWRPPSRSLNLPRWTQRLLIPGLVLGLTGVLYSVLEPDFGWNEHTIVLFGSAVLGVGLVTYVCSGLEAFAARRWMGAQAAVRPFPACIAIAAASVALSRVLDLQPGVMYGFVASCVVVAPVASTSAQGGRVALAPTAGALLVAVAAWLLVGPIRDLNEDHGGWLPGTLEATAIVVFIGGIEGIVIGMLPLPETDGGKLFRWHRWLWFLVAITAAFLTWHVLLGRERSYFSGLREAASLTVLVVFVLYTALTAAIWGYFRFRKAPLDEPIPGPAPAA